MLTFRGASTEQKTADLRSQTAAETNASNLHTPQKAFKQRERNHPVDTETAGGAGGDGESKRIQKAEDSGPFE